MIAELSDTQRQIVEADNATIAVEACAGSGKTRAIVERAKRLAGEGRSVSVVAFTRSAVDELRHRIANDAVTVTTVHGLAHGIVAHVTRGRPLWVATQAEVDDAISDARRSLGYDRKCSIKSVEDALRERPEGTGYAVLVANEVRLRLAESNRIDFDGLVQRACAAIRDGSVVVPHSDILIDEAQDLHRGLWDIVDAAFAANPATRICAVGDPRQAIFGFLGGSRERFEAFCDRADLFVAMVENYRCATSIVEYANELAATGIGDGGMVATRDVVGIFSVDRSPLSVLVRDVLTQSLGPVAVIARTNRELDETARALAADGIDFARIPTMRAGTDATARVIAWIRCLANQQDEVAARVYAGNDAAKRQKLQDAIAASAPPGGWVRAEKFEPKTVEEAAELARFDATVAAGWNATDYLEAWTRQEVLDVDLGGIREANVVLATAHTAKGREWPAVIVLADGFRRGGSDSARALYVAVTRAQNCLAVKE